VKGKYLSYEMEPSPCVPFSTLEFESPEPPESIKIEFLRPVLS